MALHPQLVKHQKFTVRTYEIDHRKRATVPALVKLMHEAAMQNVLDLNLSVWDLEPHRISWVLMRKNLKINQLPNLGETIEVVTHCAGFEKFFTYRDYKIYNASRELIAQAASTWLLMDTVKRRMTRIPDFILAIESPPPETCLPRPKNRLPKFEQVDLERRRTVGYFDLDFNHHLNNVFYLQWMLDTVPDDWLQHRQLVEMDIVYKLECGWREEVVCQTQLIDDRRLLHQLVRASDGKQLSLAETHWSE